LLDRQEQATGLVQVDVVWPAVDGREPLCAGSSAAATVAHAVRACAVPGHPDQEPAVVPVIGRPPFLRIGHQFIQVLLDRRQIEFFELLGVVEVLAHRIAQVRMLMEDIELELVGPPVPVGRAAGGWSLARLACHWTFHLFRH